MGITITKPIYKGKEANDFLTKAFFKPNALSGFTLLPNVKDKFGLNFLNFNGLVLGPANCAFTPNVNAELTDKQDTVDTYDVNFEECVETFEQSYLADTLKAGANNAALPKSFEDWLMTNLPLKVADELERKAFTQILAELQADAAVIDVVILPITTLNAIEELAKIYLAIPEELMGSEDLAIYVNTTAWKSYQIAAFDTSVPQLITDGIKMTYLGVELIMAPVDSVAKGGGLPNDKVIAGEQTNFVRATDLLSDETTFKIIDLRETTGDMIIRVTGRIKFKATYGIGSEIVLAEV